MNFISIGIHCVVADAIKMANKRINSFPFDYMWCPAKTTLNILEYLINEHPHFKRGAMDRTFQPLNYCIWDQTSESIDNIINSIYN